MKDKVDVRIDFSQEPGGMGPDLCYVLVLHVTFCRAPVGGMKHKCMAEDR